MYFEYISFGYIGDVSDYAYEPFDHFYMKMEVLFECTCEKKHLIEGSISKIL